MKLNRKGFLKLAGAAVLAAGMAGSAVAQEVTLTLHPS